MFVEAECVRWLKDVRYWLGYVVGRYGRLEGIEDDVSVNCDATGLMSEWRGRVVYIDGVKGSSFEKALRRCPSYIFDFFHFGLDRVCALSDQNHADIKKYTDLVESLILDNFPGILQLNTWALCDYTASDLCEKIGVNIWAFCNLGLKTDFRSQSR